MRRLRARSCAIFALAMLSVTTTKLWSQGFSPYSDFENMSLQELATLQVKMTYVGPRRSVLPSVVFTSLQGPLEISDFAPFRRPGISYLNESVPPRTFTATVEVLDEVIDNAGTLPAVRAGGVAERVFLSFALLNTNPTTRAFESVLNKEESAELFTRLRQSLAGNTRGLRTISEMACALGLLEPGRPADVTASVEVKVTGLRPDRHTGWFVGSVSVRNNSGSTLAAPLSLVLDLPGNVRLAKDDGTTCGTSPVGRQFVHLPVPPTGLAPGETVTLTVQLVNPDKEAISSTGFKLLAGPGAR